MFSLTSWLIGRSGTQQDQDKADEAARKKAMKDLVQSWMDRLQLISLLVCHVHTLFHISNTTLTCTSPLHPQTTFFAGMEAQIISAAAPTDDGPVSKISQTANAAIVGSLVVHSYAGTFLSHLAFIV
jgi:hypothetical protein